MLSVRKTCIPCGVDPAVSRAGRTASLRYALAAVLGLVRPPVEVPVRASWRRAEASGWEAPADAVNPLQFGRAYQLPPFGRGNGVEALFWTALARVPADRADALLTALAGDGIAGWAAPVRGSGRAAALEDVWAASAEVERAQDVAMRVLAGPEGAQDAGGPAA